MSAEPANLIADAIHEHVCANAAHAWPDVRRRDRRRHEETARNVLSELAAHDLLVISAEDLRAALSLTVDECDLRTADDPYSLAVRRLQNALDQQAEINQLRADLHLEDARFDKLTDVAGRLLARAEQAEAALSGTRVTVAEEIARALLAACPFSGTYHLGDRCDYRIAADIARKIGAEG